MVNVPNWLPLLFKVADNDWFHPSSPQLVTYQQELDLRRAVLTRVIRFRDDAGRTTRVTSRRFLSQTAPHVAVLDSTFEAEDWSGPMTVRSALDGRVANRNVAADQLLTGTHLTPRRAAEIDGETVLLEMETTQSGIHIAMASRTRALRGSRQLALSRRLLTDDTGWVAHEFELQLEQGHPVRVEKVVFVGQAPRVQHRPVRTGHGPHPAASTLPAQGQGPWSRGQWRSAAPSKTWPTATGSMVSVGEKAMTLVKLVYR
jgi:trehalose/maltose hydrolase-like predicted phosphorylase